MKDLFPIAIDFIKFVRNHFSDHIVFNVSDQTDKIEIRIFLLSTSVKPELTIFIYDTYYDVFLDTKHKITHERCFCKANVKDLIKAYISEYFSV